MLHHISIVLSPVDGFVRLDSQQNDHSVQQNHPTLNDHSIQQNQRTLKDRKQLAKQPITPSQDPHGNPDQRVLDIPLHQSHTYSRLPRTTLQSQPFQQQEKVQHRLRQTQQQRIH